VFVRAPGYYSSAHIAGPAEIIQLGTLELFVRAERWRYRNYSSEVELLAPELFSWASGYFTSP